MREGWPWSRDDDLPRVHSVRDPLAFRSGVWRVRAGGIFGGGTGQRSPFTFLCESQVPLGNAGQGGGSRVRAATGASNGRNTETARRAYSYWAGMRHECRTPIGELHATSSCGPSIARFGLGGAARVRAATVGMRSAALPTDSHPKKRRQALHVPGGLGGEPQASPRRPSVTRTILPSADC